MPVIVQGRGAEQSWMGLELQRSASGSGSGKNRYGNRGKERQGSSQECCRRQWSLQLVKVTYEEVIMGRIQCNGLDMSLSIPPKVHVLKPVSLNSHANDEWIILVVNRLGWKLDPITVFRRYSVGVLWSLGS